MAEGVRMTWWIVSLSPLSSRVRSPDAPCELSWLVLFLTSRFFSGLSDFSSLLSKLILIKFKLVSAVLRGQVWTVQRLPEAPLLCCQFDPVELRHCYTLRWWWPITRGFFFNNSIWSYFHLCCFRWVVMTFPGIPVNPFTILGTSIYAIQVGLMTFFVPPRSFVILGTMFSLFWIVFLVFGGK